MKGIYICDCDLLDLASGVNKKINAQIKILQDSGIEVDIFDRNIIDYKSINNVNANFNALFGNASINMKKILLKVEVEIKKERYDFIYIRKEYMDKSQLMILKRIKHYSPNTKILVEIPTYPYDLEAKINRWLQLNLDKKARRGLNKVVDRIVTFSKDEYIFGVKTINIMNGIIYKEIPVRNFENHNGINVIAVALFAEWHGYDRFIQGMKDNIKIVKEKNMCLLLVGKGRVLKKYNKLLKNTGLENYVKFYGEKKGEELNSLYSISDIALDSMGRHRVNVFYNSTLKGKEYCAQGIPIISGVETELDSMKDFQYYLRVPADESFISISEVIKFYDKVYKKRNINNVIKEIRESTEEIFDLRNTFYPIVKYLKG